MADCQILDMTFIRQFESELEHSAVTDRLRRVLPSMDVQCTRLGSSLLCLLKEDIGRAHPFKLSINMVEPKLFEIRMEPFEDNGIASQESDAYLICRRFIILERAFQAISQIRVSSSVRARIGSGAR